MPVVAGPPQGHGPSTFDKSEYILLTSSGSKLTLVFLFLVKMGAMMGTCMAKFLISGGNTIRLTIFQPLE